MSVDYRDSIVPWIFKPDNIELWAEHLEKENAQGRIALTQSKSLEHLRQKDRPVSYQNEGKKQ
jgi:hypothetical protein